MEPEGTKRRCVFLKHLFLAFFVERFCPPPQEEVHELAQSQSRTWARLVAHTAMQLSSMVPDRSWAIRSPQATPPREHSCTRHARWQPQRSYRNQRRGTGRWLLADDGQRRYGRILVHDRERHDRSRYPRWLIRRRCGYQRRGTGLRGTRPPQAGPQTHFCTRPGTE
jgi:hypothetical protein